MGNFYWCWYPCCMVYYNIADCARSHHLPRNPERCCASLWTPYRTPPRTRPFAHCRKPMFLSSWLYLFSLKCEAKHVERQHSHAHYDRVEKGRRIFRPAERDETLTRFTLTCVLIGFFSARCGRLQVNWDWPNFVPVALQSSAQCTVFCQHTCRIVCCFSYFTVLGVL